MKICRLCDRFIADLPKERPLFCLLCWRSVPTVYPP